jgi:pimeloyl-ACP methyl ester carboxylesterase
MARVISERRDGGVRGDATSLDNGTKRASQIAKVATATDGASLTPAVSGTRREVRNRSGRLSYYVAGDGPPLLLVHSINAAASAYEIKPLFEALQATRRVYAVDLPGFGFSDRSERQYEVGLYVDAIRDMLEVIANECGAGQRVDALAISLSCEFLARVASEDPNRFHYLAFVTPTGFDKRSETLCGPQGSTREIGGLHAFLKFPLWSQGLFNLLVSEKGIRYFLEKTFGSKDIDEGLAAYDYQTAHQPGAKNAPFAFVSGRLFSKDIRAVYERVSQPVWMPHATRGDFKDFSGADWVRCRPGWTVQPMPTGALPHFEQPERFLAIYKRLLEGAGKGVRGADQDSSSSPS